MVAKISALLAVSLLAGTGCSPKTRIEVPEGWQVRRTVETKDGGNSTVLAPSNGVSAWVIVVCGPLGQNSPRQEYLNVMRSLEDEGAQIHATLTDPDFSHLEIFFGIETEEGSMRGKVLIKLDSAGHDHLLNVQGIWPAALDDVFTPIFDAVAASADFR